MLNSAGILIWSRLACLAHAIAVSLVWYMLFVLDKDVVAPSAWVALAATWPLWSIATWFAGRSRRLGWCVVLVVGLIILSPTLSTLYSFVVWHMGGFAP